MHPFDVLVTFSLIDYKLKIFLKFLDQKNFENIGMTIGVLLVIVAAVVCLICIYRRRRRQKSEEISSH